MKNSGKVKSTLFLAAVGMVLILAAVMKKPRGTPNSSITGAVAPEWTLRDLDGKTVKSADFKGKVVILDFWATWCPPCRAEIPGFIDLQKKYGKEGLVVIGASFDQGGVSVVKPFVKRLQVNYPILMATEKINSDFGGIEALPTTFIIDRQGRIALKHEGYAEPEVFERAIQPLLKAKSA